MKRIIFLIMFSLAGCLMLAQIESWTHFRGTGLNGISESTGIPVRWSDTENVLWKAEIPGKGWSSPVIYGNQVWITTAESDGKVMYALCHDFRNGRELFRIKLFEPAKVQSKHDFNTFATPTPCIEKEYAYFHFGTYGTACVRTSDGKVVWKRIDLNCEHVQGPGSSPILYKNMLILHIEGTDVQYIIALDKRTGETVWKTDRPPECYQKLKPIGKKAYITPIVVNVNGRDLIISNGSAACIAYDAETGKEVWRIVQGEDSTIAMPLTENGIVYFFTSFVTPPNGEQYCELLAVNPGGRGDISGSNILWRLKFPILQLLTPVIKDGLIYTVDTRNNLFCLDAKTGNTVYTSRLKAKYNSSPVWAEGRVYFTSVNSETMILKAGSVLEIVGRNKISGEVYSTPAVLRGSVIMRTGSHLMRISEQK